MCHYNSEAEWEALREKLRETAPDEFEEPETEDAEPDTEEPPEPAVPADD